MTANEDETRPWYKSNAFIIAMIGILATALVGLVVDRLQRPSSNDASIVLEVLDPGLFGGSQHLQINGSGWNGDTAVSIDYPFFDGQAMQDVLVTEGRFSWDFYPTVSNTGDYTLQVRGRQSGHTESDTLRIIGRF